MISPPNIILDLGRWAFQYPARSQALQVRTCLLEYSFHRAPGSSWSLLLWLELQGATLPDFSPLQA